MKMKYVTCHHKSNDVTTKCNDVIMMQLDHVDLYYHRPNPAASQCI